jgi:hypothetical protein
LAVAAVVARAEELTPDQLRDPVAWQGILAAADEAVSEDPVAGFASLIGFAVAQGWVCGASNGDAALLLSQPEPEWLTERQRKNPPIGSGAAVPTRFQASLSSGWQLLAMSDGVWRALGMEGVQRMAGRWSGEELLRELRAGAGPHSRPPDDDFTALLVGP